jgi:general L-amino acid transport system permease protein
MALDDRAESLPPAQPPAAFLSDARTRGIAAQIVFVIVLILLVVWIGFNTYANLQRSNIASGFGFLWQRAGFDISQTPIPYTMESSYGRAFFVGLINTLIVAAAGIVFATIIGLITGIARLSSNWLIARLATVYVEIFRNVPVLLQLLFWYKAVLSVLPGPRQAYEFPFSTTLSNRGLITPRFIFEPAFAATAIAFVVGVVAAIVIGRWAKRRQMATGQPFPSVSVGLGIVVALPVLMFLITGMPVNVQYPELAGFNFEGGFHVAPEFLALLLGLVLYTATYIAEIVRGGILAVSRGQSEASAALGLHRGLSLRLVVLPQALRVIIPPLTSQYLNLIKNSSLAVAVGYPDLVAVFARTVLNQTGQAVEVIFITMLVYLFISLLASAFMNWFNARVALVER